jgi:cytochrome c-type biogenesis protein CcmH/NrfF
MRRIAVAALALALLAPTLAHGQGRASFNDVEDEVMCTVCRTPLNLAPADAPFAQRQRAFIRRLLARGRSKDEVKAALARQYGPQVLAMPEDDGFGLAAYLVPILVGGTVLALVAIALPRWRRRTDDPLPDAPEPSPAEARRLDEDLARYEG